MGSHRNREPRVRRFDPKGEVDRLLKTSFEYFSTATRTRVVATDFVATRWLIHWNICILMSLRQVHCQESEFFRLALPVSIPAQTASIPESRVDFESLPKPDVPSVRAER